MSKSNDIQLRLKTNNKKSRDIEKLTYFEGFLYMCDCVRLFSEKYKYQILKQSHTNP